MPHYKRPFLTALMVLLAMLLSGCQSFSSLFSHDSTTVLLPTPTQSIAKHEFPVNDQQNMVGKLAVVNSQEGDTLSDIARHYGLGYTDISIANPNITPWTPRAGSQVLLPLQFILPEAPHKGIVLNLANMRLFHYPKKQAQVETYPVSIGRDGWNTPMGLTRVAIKTANPEWHVPDSIYREHAQKGDILPRVVRSGPSNPLGYYAMRLAIPRYLIHGTNKPYGIGMQVSHGCIQLYPEDIEVLFNDVKVGTPVHIVHQPYLAAWDQDMLYVEAHDPVSQAGGGKSAKKKAFIKQLKKMSKTKSAKVDWDKVNAVLQRADGIPTPVLVNSPDITALSNSAMHLTRPSALYGQPAVAPLTNSDWSILVDTFKDEVSAQRMVAMLTHQGPSIPARKVQKGSEYQVIAGPFKDAKETKAFAKRIRYEFEVEVKPIEPVILSSQR
ncbi:L,D-transpeptidase family protein [Crenothrix sp.]|uniref:L,D-transpeptidase family protein n=1 Tax=Crenothrix sp. TaxID=3100433 RepID=UPI00374CF399